MQWHKANKLFLLTIFRMKTDEMSVFKSLASTSFAIRADPDIGCLTERALETGQRRLQPHSATGEGNATRMRETTTPAEAGAEGSGDAAVSGGLGRN